MATTSTTNVACDIANIELADLGKKRIEWANQSMKVLQIIRKDFIKNQPLKGFRIAACLHVTAETANLMITLRDGGAEAVLCASNPLSTQDDVAAASELSACLRGPRPSGQPARAEPQPCRWLPT